MLSSVKTSALLRALHPRAVGLASISHSACLATRSVTKLLATPAEESPSPLRKDTSAANTLQEDRHPSKGSRKCLTLSRLGGSSEYISLPHALSPGDPLVAASPAPFLFYPAYLSPEEQRVLLQASLLKLDGNGGHSKAVRLKRKKRLAEEKARRCFRAPPHYGFLPEDMYDFQEGHFDGVIRQYRECHLTDWPADDTVFSKYAHVGPPLSTIVNRLKNLFRVHTRPQSTDPLPTKSQLEIQTHLLHLSSQGSIGPHVDHVEASGSIIMGVSLGATRVLRMTRRTTGKDESKELEPVLEPGHPASDWIGLESMSDRARAGTTAASPDSGRLQSFEVLLVPGSVYIQRDAIRYEFDHAIPAEDTFQGQHIPPGQRLSIMIRDKKATASSLKQGMY